MGSQMKKRWDATSIYNIAVCLVVASIISGTISFIAVWMALPNSKTINYTHQDVVVDIFGVLVTVLIGWNILSVVDIKKKAEKIDAISNDLEKVISGMIQLSIHSFTLRPDKEAIISSCFASLEKVLGCENEDVRNSGVKEIMKVLHQLKNSYDAGQSVYIYQGHMENYKSILWNLNDEYKEEIESMIKDAKVLNTNGKVMVFSEGGKQTTYATENSADVEYSNNN